MTKIEFVSTADWNAATEKAIKGKGYKVADDPRCLYGWGPSKDGNSPGGCFHMFGHACSRPFRHKGKCMADDGIAAKDRYPCEAVMRPSDWDDKVRTECNE
jgi:hypothetical protein